MFNLVEVFRRTGEMSGTGFVSGRYREFVEHKDLYALYAAPDYMGRVFEVCDECNCVCKCAPKFYMDPTLLTRNQNAVSSNVMEFICLTCYVNQNECPEFLTVRLAHEPTNKLEGPFLRSVQYLLRKYSRGTLLNRFLF